MDSGVDEELNYEEDELENDESCNDIQSRECTQDNATDNSKLVESEDQYLQIDYLEDENLAGDETPLGSVTSKADDNDDDGKATGTGENSNQDKVSSVQKEFNFLKKLDDNVGNKTKRKKRLRTFQRRAEFKKKVTNAFCLNPWLPEYNFSDSQQGLPMKNTMLNANPEFYPIQSSPRPQMMPKNNKRYKQSPTTSLGIGVSSQGFPQLSNNPTAKLLGQPFNNDGSKVLLSRTFGYKDVEPNMFSKTCGSRDSSGFDQNQNFRRTVQPYGDNFQINDSTKTSYKMFSYNGNANSVGTPFSEQETNKTVKTEDRFINNVQYKSLEEDEKKVLMMKKEARLKRFMQDDIIKKDKLTDSGFEESSQYGSPTKVQFFEKKEKKFNPEDDQKQDHLSSNQRESLPGKPDINKELLLRKKNPFGGNGMMPNFTLTTKPDQTDGVKVERVDTKAWTMTTSYIGEELMKTEKKPSIPGQTFAPIKTEKEPHVKFIRTVSKTFDELTFRKPKTEAPESQGKLFPFGGQKIPDSFPKQLEPQLTGCIVKVLNIPPSTTTNDILALCSPIGIVLEVRLNCPKENSVVIRFAEPKCAENFFSLYHGQKMNNYFLNVIVV